MELSPVKRLVLLCRGSAVKRLEQLLKLAQLVPIGKKGMQTKNVAKWLQVFLVIGTICGKAEEVAW